MWARDGRSEDTHRQGGHRRRADAAGGGRRVRPDDVRRGDPVADGRPADGAAGARRDRGRNHRRGVGHARTDAARDRAGGRRRHRRHRRRRLRLGECLDLRVVRRCGRRRAGRQAWQPRAVVEIGRRRRARRARRQDRTDARPGRPLHPRGRHRLHVRAGASSGHAQRRPDPRRARHPHDLQPARAAVEPGRRQAADDRRVLAPVGAAARGSAEESRRRVRSGSCTAPTASTRSR